MEQLGLLEALREAGEKIKQQVVTDERGKVLRVLPPTLEVEKKYVDERLQRLILIFCI